MIQMILLKFFIIFRTCYGTSDDLKKDLEKSWAEFDKQLKCDHLQYIGYNEGMEDDMDMHSKIKRQYLSSINNIRNWHGVEPLKQNNELDVFAQSYANYEARVERNVTFNSVFGLLLSSRPYLFSNDVGKKVPYELYRYFDDDDKPFDFEANEDEMIKRIIHPKPHVLGKYKENITPRNLDIMKHDGYFEFLQEAKKRDKNIVKYELQSYAKKLMGSSSKRNISLEKKEN
ncbi:uncharacterized protein LOC126902327 isoform X16 [Daktulosphaira vitifoliae]|uniref:uncharacterized protein LOC126902327 isoform X16 n=1 Tax=Daktulosphaira vitifoliae TaxID=58002 RepID=UPI0021AA89AF|nr:uncharacterized protein LOC126902327 isoform X16 [Daktulosphaira vitifoliae]